MMKSEPFGQWLRAWACELLRTCKPLGDLGENGTDAKIQREIAKTNNTCLTTHPRDILVQLSPGLQ